MATLTEIQIQIGQYGTVPGNVNLYVYAADDNNNPTGSLLGSASVACSSLPQYSQEFSTPYTSFSGLSVTINSYQKYIWWIQAPDVVDGYIRVYINATSTKGDFNSLLGRESLDGGTTWSGSGSIHCCIATIDGDSVASGTASGWVNVVKGNRCRGDVFTITGLPGKPINPSPADTASNITLDQSPLSWEDGGGSDTYEIYFREQGDNWELVGETQAGVSWTITFGTLAYGTTYEWRIDATNIFGTTTGDTWSFDTLVFAPPQVSYILISGGSGSGPYDDPPGVEGTDWNWTGESGMMSVRRLIVAANNKIFYEVL